MEKNIYALPPLPKQQEQAQQRPHTDPFLTTVDLEDRPTVSKKPSTSIKDFHKSVGNWGKLRLHVVRNLGVEDVSFNGLKDPPIAVDYDGALGLVLEALNKENVSYSDICDFLNARESKTILEVLFWYVFCAFFQPTALPLLQGPLRDIGQDFARLYWKTLNKERFYIEIYHVLLSEVILRVLRKHFQQSEYIKSQNLEHRVHKLLGLILTGMVPRMEFVKRTRALLFQSEHKQKVTEYIAAFQEALKAKRRRSTHNDKEKSTPRAPMSKLMSTMNAISAPRGRPLPGTMDRSFPTKKMTPKSTLSTPRNYKQANRKRGIEHDLIKDYLVESLEEFFILGTVDPEEASTTFWNLYTTSPLVASYVGIPVEFRTANRRKMKVLDTENTQKGNGIGRIRQIVEEIMESSSKETVRRMMMSPRAQEGHATVTARESEIDKALKKLPINQRVERLLRIQEDMGRRIKRKQLWDRPQSSVMFQQSLQRLKQIEQDFDNRNKKIESELRRGEDYLQREFKSMRKEYNEIQNDPNKRRQFYTEIVQKHRKNYLVARKNVDPFFTRGTVMADVAINNARQVETHLNKAQSVLNKVQEYKKNARKNSFHKSRRQPVSIYSLYNEKPTSKLLERLEIEL